MGKKPVKSTSVVSQSAVENRIHIVRGKRVMVDRDLALLYNVSTGVLNQAVKRNLERFPDDFMFQLSKEEMENWISQIVISNSRAKMALRKRPYVFTEQGVAMLSSVLNSQQAIQVNIQIMRTFIHIRQAEDTYRDIWGKIDELEKKYDKQFQVVFKAIKMLLDEKPKDPPSRF